MEGTSPSERKSGMQRLPRGMRHSVSHRVSQHTLGLLHAISIVQSKRTGLEEEGLTSGGFAFGVINSFLAMYVLGAWPQHFWLFYSIECGVLLLVRTYSWVALKLQFYMLDFCWVANFVLCGAALMAGITHFFPDTSISPWVEEYASAGAVQRQCWLVLFSVATGPLAWAILATNNSLVFHSFEHMATLFIHSFPMLAAWCMRWSAGARPTYGNVLGNDAEHTDLLNELFLPACATYGSWWVLYTLWLCTDGITRPERGYDTVFGNFAGLVQDKLGLPSIRAAAFVYMLFHGVACTASFGFALLCYEMFWFHTAFVLAMLLSAVHSGAKLYSYYMLDLYEEAVRDKLSPNAAKELV